jgi:hypothetical protein
LQLQSNFDKSLSDSNVSKKILVEMFLTARERNGEVIILPVKFQTGKNGTGIWITTTEEFNI